MPVLKNPKHERFCQELSKGKSAAEAYKLAGFKPSSQNASTLKQKNDILNRTAELMAEREEMDRAASEKALEALALDKQWVLSRLMDNVERAMQAEPVRTNGGEATGEYKYDGNVANRALELLGKHVGLFRDKIEVTGKDGGPIEHEHSIAADAESFTRSVLGLVERKRSAESS